MKNYLFVVEMRNEKTGDWEPTVGCGLDMSSARREISEWMHNNPSDKFRIRKYVTESDK